MMMTSNIFIFTETKHTLHQIATKVCIGFDKDRKVTMDTLSSKINLSLFGEVIQ